jgi:TIR domain-containing protein
MASKVFINYRRSESLKDARHLASLLDHGALKGHIFIDLKGLDGAEDWLIELERQVAASDVVLSLICPNWSEIRDTTGKRRIDDETDFVRFELAEAFRRKIPVVPVLVDGASMPRGEKLPPNLLLLTRPQAEVLRTETFDTDVAKIHARLRAEIGERRRQRRRGVPVWVGAAMAIAGLVTGLVAGPFGIERLGLMAPLAAERTRSLEASYAEANSSLTQARAVQAQTETDLRKAQTDLQRMQSEFAATSRDRDTARAGLMQLGEEMKKTKAALDLMIESAKFDGDRLKAVVGKCFKPCSNGVMPYVDRDGKTSCLVI